jgi:hypothetical protein
LIELTVGGKQPIALPGGEIRFEVWRERYLTLLS